MWFKEFLKKKKKEVLKRVECLVPEECIDEFYDLWDLSVGNSKDKQTRNYTFYSFINIVVGVPIDISTNDIKFNLTNVLKPYAVYYKKEK